MRLCCIMKLVSRLRLKCFCLITILYIFLVQSWILCFSGIHWHFTHQRFQLRRWSDAPDTARLSPPLSLMLLIDFKRVTDLTAPIISHCSHLPWALGLSRAVVLGAARGIHPRACLFLSSAETERILSVPARSPAVRLTVYGRGERIWTLCMVLNAPVRKICCSATQVVAGAGPDGRF